MDQIYAKLKRLRKDPFRKILSDQTLFDTALPDPEACNEYLPSILLDDDEWHKVSNFSSREFCPDILKAELISSDFENLAKEDFENIAFLMAFQDGNYFFQRVRPSSFVKRKVLTFGDAAFIEQASNRIVIGSQPDAVFNPVSDAVLFRDLAAVSPLFPGIDQLFKEATEEQVEEFLTNDFIDSTIPTSAVSKPNRKRIALAMDSLGKMSASEREDVIQYINTYCKDKLPFDEDKGAFKLSTDDDVKTLVYGIEQRFYTTLIGAEKRLANSVVKLE